MGLLQHVSCTPQLFSPNDTMIGAKQLLPRVVCVAEGKISICRSLRLATREVTCRPFFKNGYVKRSGKPGRP